MTVSSLQRGVAVALWVGLAHLSCAVFNEVSAAKRAAAEPPASGASVRPVSDLEPMERLVMAWPASVGGDIDAFMAELVTAAAPYVPITVLVESRARQAEVEATLRAYAGQVPELEFVLVSIDSVWIRDYGPLFVRTLAGAIEAVDHPYHPERPDDDRVPHPLSDALGLPLRVSELMMEGGHFTTDQEGRCIVTDEVFTLNAYRDLGTTDVEDLLRVELGCQQVTVVPALSGEATGHVDGLLFVTGPGQALVGRYEPAEDQENAELLDQAAELLQLDGFEVRRVTLPSNDERRRFRTYLNALPLDGAVLVPVFDEDRRHEEEALRAFVDAFPGRTILPVRADRIIWLDGSVRCTAVGVPRGALSVRSTSE